MNEVLWDLSEAKRDEAKRREVEEKAWSRNRQM